MTLLLRCSFWSSLFDRSFEPGVRYVDAQILLLTRISLFHRDRSFISVFLEFLLVLGREETPAGAHGAMPFFPYRDRGNPRDFPDFSMEEEPFSLGAGP